jgi:hypothetical protein
MDIKAVLGLKKDDAITGLVARITSIYEPKAVGKFKNQSIKITDASGDIFVSLFNFQIPETAKEQEIHILKGKCNVYYSAKNKVNVWGINVAKLEDIVIGQIQREETPPEGIQASEIKSRSMSLAYAKDLCIGGKIAFSEVLQTAQTFDNYLNTGVVPEPTIEFGCGE